MNIDKRNFLTDNPEEASYESILARYPDKEKCRVSLYRYEPGSEFPGTSREGLCFVISGRCDFKFSDGCILIAEKGELFNFPPGDYWLKTNPKVGVEYVMVWDLEKIGEFR